MKVTQEKLPDSQIGLEIEISPEKSQQTYETVVQNLARTTQIPGFRKGKIPRQVLVQRLGSQRLKAAALEEIIQSSLQEAVKQESIEVLGNYQLRSSFEELLEKYKPGESFSFSASVDVPPTVQLGDYQSLQIKAEETPYDPQKVDAWFDEQREKFVTLVPVEERSAQMGDVAIIDYQAKKASETEGNELEPIPGVEGTDFRVELGEGRFISGFVEGIVGMKPDETKDITATFPSDYPQEELAGQEAIFTVTLKELKEKELPELDDDFAEQLAENSEQKFETLAEWRDYLEKQVQEQAENETKNSIHAAIIKELVNISSVDVPETLIQDEVTELLRQTAVQMQQMGVDIKTLFTPENVNRMRENARPEAIERLKQTLVLREVAKVESLQADTEAIEERYNKLVSQLEGQDIDLERLREVITEEILTQKTLDWLQEKATVELVPKQTSDTEEETELDPGDETIIETVAETVESSEESSEES
ncbi:trigger factor [Gloeothece citriformis PCC 7424]|uniref:Trigger factor n=1 Tax=Gloeothece citriformis (strain PCC 7424) TaxID=65393 RepID=B7KBH9_GLOC7|nr:trigger factor [Gloeothece citriformis]ACK71535.1 trigger factor [Gloeothece citriformis PCC 7424]